MRYGDSIAVTSHTVPSQGYEIEVTLLGQQIVRLEIFIDIISTVVFIKMSYHCMFMKFSSNTDFLSPFWTCLVFRRLTAFHASSVFISNVA